MGRVLVIIPAYNEAESLERVVEAVRASVPGADVAVVNDGSRDGTGALVDRLGVIALHLPHNLGTGAAEQTGFRYAVRFGYPTVVRSDADGQHHPAEIAGLVAALEGGDADVVIGSRFLEDRGYVTPRWRRLGIRVLAGAIGLVCRRRFTDPTSGFRAFGPRAVRLAATLYPADYPEAESIVLFVRSGLRVREVPVTMRPRGGGHSSIGGARSAYYMVKVMLAVVVWLLRAAPAVPPDGKAGGEGP
jgi:glycosyltransferase involved in cell wall biosynthesis